ncbi:conserved hypothetical protein [Prochlorococcus marinus str. MIT 9515]|uniref:Uncharacterized protein n=1 Tax=Prochlorococcus marinus (strain MIT 9515) TaxID=167542 RepID=A2BVP9_PROM5|nr:hypothetical protein [Prochlorococcus marinus]ABM71860.1 conserved hypothetical protein [Prochlorococcus marinus str. MIT 9515]
MNNFLLLVFLSLSYINPILSQSNLLESVKKNPSDAIKMCNKFKELNSKGISASSDKAIEFVAKKNNLNPINAEILSIYVIGLHCPQVI